jgi:hypothetical protein
MMLQAVDSQDVVDLANDQQVHVLQTSKPKMWELWLGSTDKTRQAKTTQDNRRQDKTSQGKTKHDKTRQDKTRQG